MDSSATPPSSSDRGAPAPTLVEGEASPAGARAGSGEGSSGDAPARGRFSALFAEDDDAGPADAEDTAAQRMIGPSLVIFATYGMIRAVSLLGEPRAVVPASFFVGSVVLYALAFAHRRGWRHVGTATVAFASLAVPLLQPHLATFPFAPLSLSLPPLAAIVFASRRAIVFSFLLEVVVLELRLRATGQSLPRWFFLNILGFSAALWFVRTVLAMQRRERRDRIDALQEVNAVLRERDERLQETNEELQRKTVELQKVEANFKRMSDSTNDLISIVDYRGIYTYVSPGFLSTSARPVTDFVGRPAAENLHPEDVRRFEDEFRRNPRFTGKILHRFRASEGTYRWFESMVTPYEEASGEKLRLIVSRDVTERIDLEAELQHAQRMEGIGRLAGGIAHDFNNLAMAIQSYSELAASRLAIDHPVYEDLVEIRRATERAGSLTRQLLAFARKQVLTAKRSSPREIVAGMERLLLRVLPARVSMHLRIDADVGDVVVDGAQIEQVLMNLAINANDAMPDGGELTFFVCDEEISGEQARQLAIPEAMYVAFSVQDTGLGMNDIQKQRAFEPFFTTKPIGKGTGLGLATCYGIARQHGGAMRLVSTVGEGTTITLLLPRAPVAELDAPSSGLEKSRRSTRHLNSAPPSPKTEIALLLVEDEDAVRRAFTRQLRDAGYRVVAAASGEEALEYVAKEEFALVVTDVVMPGVGGRVVVERLQERSPNARVIFMSGYVDDEVFQREGIPADACFLQKPFPAAVLLRAIRDQLAEH